MQVLDQSGVAAPAAVTASVGGSALTVAVDASVPGGRSVLHLRDFAGLPESVTVEAASLSLAAGAGMQPLTLVVTDRCGNVTTSALCSVWKKTTAGGAAFGYVPYQDQGFPTTVGVLGPHQLSWQSPISLLATAADVIAVDQYLGTWGGVDHYASAARLTPASGWDGLAGQGPALWELQPVPCDGSRLMKTKVVLRDAVGNRTGDVEVMTAWQSTHVTVPEVGVETTILKNIINVNQDQVIMRQFFPDYVVADCWQNCGWKWDAEFGIPPYISTIGNTVLDAVISPLDMYIWGDVISPQLQNGFELEYNTEIIGKHWFIPNAAKAIEKEVPIPWCIDQQPTMGSKLLVTYESRPSCIQELEVSGNSGYVSLVCDFSPSIRFAHGYYEPDWIWWGD